MASWSLLTLLQLLLMLWSLVTKPLCPNVRMVWGSVSPENSFIIFPLPTKQQFILLGLACNQITIAIILPKNEVHSSYPKVEFSTIRYLANAYKWMWKVLMASSVNKSMLFKMPYHVQGSACPPKFTKTKPPRTLGLRNTTLKCWVPKPGGKCSSNLRWRLCCKI